MKFRALKLTATVLSALSLSFAALAAEIYTPGSADDPRLRSARFLGEDQRYFSAITELLELQLDAGKDFEAAPEYWASLARYQLSFGMHDRAEAMYRSIAAANADPLDAGRAKLRLAEFEYERGYLDVARSSLLRAREKLPDELEFEWKDLYARVLMAQGRYNEAASILEKISGSDDEQALLRYNLGVALINDGRVAQGRTALDRVGRHPGNSELIRSLRDRANVTLGWHFLQNQLGGSAKPVLSRVRAEGPYSNRALLGVGWAELAPEGKRQTRGELNEDKRLNELSDPLGNFSSLGGLLRRGYLDDPYDRAGIRSFRRTTLARDDESRMRRALVVWVELIDRDPQDPAVQEAWLAVPFALDRLGAHTQAVQYYEQAAERLEAARKRTLESIDAIKGGRMVETVVTREIEDESGWEWELRDLPDAPETYALQTLIAEHRYAEALKQYRDVRLMARRLDAWKDRVVKMETAGNNAARVTAEPTVLFARAKRKWKPEPVKLDLQLEEETALAAPGSYSTKLASVPASMPSLQLSQMPAKFDGPFERLQSVKTRAEKLRPLLNSAARESAAQLRKMAMDELNAQKSQVDKYLIESRFALARMYDRATPDQDQDEFELDAKGKPIKPAKLSRGEFEVDKSKPLDQQLKKPKPAPKRRGEDEEVEVK